MRHVICALGILLFGILPALPGADLTVVLSYEATHSVPAAAAMKLEAERLLKDSGASLDWRTLSELSPGESFSRLALVKLRGRCEMIPFLRAAGEPPVSLGVTYRMDGQVIPFSEVRCDEVRSAVGEGRLPPGADARELLFGRALGRVLAHELLHVLSRSGRHARSGVTQKYLSAARLLEDQID